MQPPAVAEPAATVDLELKPPKGSSGLCAFGFALAVALAVGSLLADEWFSLNASGIITQQGYDTWSIGAVSASRGDPRVPGMSCPNRNEPDDTTSRLFLCKSLLYAIIGTSSFASLCIGIAPICLSMPRFVKATRVLMLPAMASCILSCIAIAYIGETFMEWMYCGARACDYLDQVKLSQAFLATVVTVTGSLPATTGAASCSVQPWTSYGLLCACAGIQMVSLLGGVGAWIAAMGEYDRLRRLLFLDRDATEHNMASNARSARALQYASHQETESATAVKALPPPSIDGDDDEDGVEVWDDDEAIDLAIIEVEADPPPRELVLGELGTSTGWQWVEAQQMYYNGWHRVFWNPDTNQYFDPARAQWIDGPTGTRYNAPVKPPTG